MIVVGSGWGETNALLNLINHQSDIDKTYLYAKYPYEVKYQFLIKKHKDVGIRHLNDPKAFTEYPNDMQVVYENIKEYIPGKKRKVFIVFDDMIADMINNNISIVFITQSCLKVPKDVRLNSTYFIVSKIPNKRDLYNIRNNHSVDIDFIWTSLQISIFFLDIDATLASDNTLSFTQNLLERIKKTIMTIDDKIKDEKLQYDINGEAVKVSAFSIIS